MTMTALILHLGTIVGGLLVLLLSVDILRARRPPAATWGWLLFMLTLPMLAIPLYLGLGTRKLDDSRAVVRSLPENSPELDNADALQRVAISDGVAMPTPGNDIRFHRDGPQALDALLQVIGGAEQTLDLCVFLMADDGAGRKVESALIDAARRGVCVRLLLDSIGSFMLPSARFRAMSSAGVHAERFMPLIHRPFRGRNNLRNHRKIVIADNRRAWSGGRNIGAEYFADDSVWVDLSFDVRGPAVLQLSNVFRDDWQFATGESLPIADVTDSVGSDTLQFIRSGPDTTGEPLHDVLLTACYQAQSRITVVTPYFVPDESIQRALCLAAMRGVHVELILPAKSNHRIADYARTRYLRELDGSGVKIVLVDNGMVHAKAVLIDDDIVLTGSANFDLRSFFLNFESVCLIRSTQHAAALQRWLEPLRARSTPYVGTSNNRAREVFEGLVLLFAYQI